MTTKTHSIGDTVLFSAGENALAVGKITKIDHDFATIHTEDPIKVNIEGWYEDMQDFRVSLASIQRGIVETQKPIYSISTHEPDDGSTPTLPKRASIASPTAVGVLDTFERGVVADYVRAFINHEDTSEHEEILAGLYFPDESFEQMNELLTKLEAVINQALE